MMMLMAKRKTLLEDPFDMQSPYTESLTWSEAIEHLSTRNLELETYPSASDSITTETDVFPGQNPSITS